MVLVMKFKLNYIIKTSREFRDFLDCYYIAMLEIEFQVNLNLIF